MDKIVNLIPVPGAKEIFVAAGMIWKAVETDKENKEEFKELQELVKSTKDTLESNPALLRDLEIRKTVKKIEDTLGRALELVDKENGRNRMWRLLKAEKTAELLRNVNQKILGHIQRDSHAMIQSIWERLNRYDGPHPAFTLPQGAAVMFNYSSHSTTGIALPPHPPSASEILELEDGDGIIMGTAGIEAPFAPSSSNMASSALTSDSLCETVVQHQDSDDTTAGGSGWHYITKEEFNIKIHPLLEKSLKLTQTIASELEDMGVVPTSKGIWAIASKLLRLWPCVGSRASHHPPPLPPLSDDADTHAEMFVALGKFAALMLSAATEVLGNNNRRCEDGMVSPEVQHAFCTIIICQTTMGISALVIGRLQANRRLRARSRSSGIRALTDRILGSQLPSPLIENTDSQELADETDPNPRPHLQQQQPAAPPAWRTQQPAATKETDATSSADGTQASQEVPIATARPPVEVLNQLIELQSRLEFATTESLLENAGPLRSRFQDIQHQLPEELFVALHPVCYIEYRRVDYNRAHRNIDNRAGLRRLQAVAQEALKRSKVEIDKLNTATERQTQDQDRLSQLEQEKANLEAALEAKNKEIAEAQAQLEAVGVEVNTQAAVMERAIEESQAAWSEVPADIGSDDHDNYTISEIDAIRTNALNTIRHFLCSLES